MLLRRHRSFHVVSSWKPREWVKFLMRSPLNLRPRGDFSLHFHSGRDLGGDCHCPVLSGPEDEVMGMGWWPSLLWLQSLNFSKPFLKEIDSPQNLVTDRVTETTASISWDPVQAAIDRYMVRYTSADGDAREVPVGKEQSGTVLTGLRPGVEYTVHVWAEQGARESRKADTTAETGNGALFLGV